MDDIVYEGRSNVNQNLAYLNDERNARNDELISRSFSRYGERKWNSSQKTNHSQGVDAVII